MFGRVRLADDFFKKERDQLYSDWQSSFWRELFQNSIDQGCTVVRINLTPRDGCVVVDFADNGPGMSRQVLQDVYFAIGATTKAGTNQIGGMGRARVLTCFAMKSYRVRSQDYLVIGQGGDYEVQDAPYAQGCMLTIEVDGVSLDTLRAKLMTFLKESRIDARIYLNDQWITEKAPLNGRVTRELVSNDVTFAKVYVNKSASRRLIVRVNGVSMYTTETEAKAQVVVEIEPSISRSVLTSNRDSMHYEYRRVLDRFLRELAVDTNSALRPRFARRTMVARGTGLKHVRANKPATKPVQKPRPESVSGALLPRDERDTYDETRLVPSMAAVPSMFPNVDDDGDDTHLMPMVRANDEIESQPVIRSDSPERISFRHWLGITFGDIYIFDETDSVTMHKSVPGFLPSNWETRYVNGRTYRHGGNAIRLLLMWQTAVEYALEVALPVLNEDDIKYGIGFLFADDRLAEHREQDDGHLFVFRPVNREGKIDFKISNRRSLKRLMVLAQHEVTHVRERWHDEDFSRLRDEIAMRFDEGECLRRMKAALNALPALDRDVLRWAA